MRLCFDVLAPLAVLLLVTGSGRAQYWSGYGSGPFYGPTASYGSSVDAKNHADLEPARAASVLAVQLYSQPRVYQDVESPYKYQPPVFASRYQPFFGGFPLI